MIKDAPERLLATDPSQSFIVQAPAGSGKTELLSQRFLRLLSSVQQPEHIIALTFTRKAASEMKERILSTLRKTKAGDLGSSPHQQHTADLARTALENDARQNWNILKHPHRLRIMTIDALCQRLSEAIPLFDKELPFAQITNSPQLSYQNAARACLSDAINDKNLQAPIQTLLEHLDNRQDRLVSLFCELLSCREQWLEIIFTAKTHTQADFEATLKEIEQHTLDRLLNSIPIQFREEIHSLSQRVATLENNPSSPRYALCNWTSFNSIDREIANGLAHLFLTQDDKLRRALDHHVGLRKDACTDFQTLKQRSQILCENLKQLPDFEAILAQVKRLPAPTYTPKQWQVLQALFTLLPILVAELHLIFKKTNTLDFTQVTQQALHALGDEESPTDLTLYLDHTIHHLLIDEFQDTSIQQIQLIEKLVQNWLPDEGKTLFVVGDPMQSIYRFRQAEVGLFLKVRAEGIGPVRLKSLELSSNFRSTENIVDWVNTHCKTIFPQHEDIESGAISFHPSTPVFPTETSSWIKAYQFDNKHHEAQGLVQLIQQQLNDFPEENIAILVRSRNQLTEIIEQLRHDQIFFQGVDINPLSSLAHLRDMWSLTKALLYPSDRTSWLSLLRSPYGGLTLPDLHAIANFTDKQNTDGSYSNGNSDVSIYATLQQIDKLSDLSPEGKLRAQFISQVMTQALASRHQRPLIDWIIATAQQLHAQFIIEAEQHTDLEQFWQLLEQHLNQGQFPDLDTFHQEFASLYSKQATQSKLQIMTIHKSKGLEFDCVFIPSLSSRSNSPDLPLIRWLKLPAKQHKEYLLVSPIKAAHENESPLYNYLHGIENEKTSYELQRLFYVAATRTKKRLYLLDNQQRDNKGSFRYLLTQQEFINFDAETSSCKIDENEINLPLLQHLPLSFYQTPPVFLTQAVNFVTPVITSNMARQLGIITHELLQWICTYHPQSTETLPWNLIEQRCKAHGFDLEQCKSTRQTLQKQIEIMLLDPIGHWLCQAHTDEKNEYALLVKQAGQVKTRVIDRTFVEHGVRWIIDFKTGIDDEKKQQHHQSQVNQYAQLLASISAMPIYGGIYYLASNRWVSWEYTPQNTTESV